MKSINAFFIMCLIVLIAACGSREITGNGQIVSQSRMLSTIGSVIVDGNFQVVVQVGKPQSLVISADGNLLDYLETHVSDKTLLLRIKRGYTLKPRTVPVVTLMLPTLQTLKLNGNNKVILKGVTMGDLILRASGYNQFTAVGKLHRLQLDVSGNTNVDAQQLFAKKVIIKSVGNAKMLVNVAEKLDINIVGAANIGYLGQPDVNQVIDGAGVVTRLRSAQLQ